MRVWYCCLHGLKVDFFCTWLLGWVCWNTPPKTNMEPENTPLEKEKPPIFRFHIGFWRVFWWVVRSPSVFFLNRLRMVGWVRGFAHGRVVILMKEGTYKVGPGKPQYKWGEIILISRVKSPQLTMVFSAIFRGPESPCKWCNFLELTI